MGLLISETGMTSLKAFNSEGKRTLPLTIRFVISMGALFMYFLIMFSKTHYDRSSNKHYLWRYILVAN